MRTLILGIWVIALLIGVVEPTFSAEAPRKGQHLAPRGFSVGTSLSLTCNKIAYAYTGNTRQVTLRITVYGETNNLTGNVTVTGPNTNITEQVGPPSYMKDVTVTLPAGPDKFTYIATAERVDGSQMSASVDLYVVKVVSYSVSSPYYIVKNQTSSITVTLNPSTLPSSVLNLVTYQSSQPGIATATGTGTSFITKGIAPSNGDAVVRGYVDGEICNSPSNAELTVRTVWVTYHPLTNNVFRVAQQRSRTLNANVMHSSAPVTYQYATGATAPATISRNGNTFTIQGKAGRDGETMPLTAKLNGVDCGGTTIKVNRLPTVSISVPANGASYMVNAKLSIRVSTSDPDGSPHYVKILNVYVDGGLIWSTTNPSSSVSVPAFTLKNVGKHRVNVCATDDDDDSKWSAEHVFYVTPNPPAPPSGQDYEIYNPYGDYTDLHTLWLKGQLHTHWYNDADKLWGGTYGLYSPDYSRRA